VLNSEGVITTASGLKYVDVRFGSGPIAELGDEVIIDYVGWLSDGRLLDSSIDRGRPLTVSLNGEQVVPGFEEGVAGMKVGGRRVLLVPPQLAYGDQGAGSIPTNSSLVFDVELRKVN